MIDAVQGRRQFLASLGTVAALAAVPVGFVRLASGVVVTEEEAWERGHGRIWQVGDVDVITHIRLPDGRDIKIADWTTKSIYSTENEDVRVFSTQLSVELALRAGG